jgi:chromosome partitioning protein
MTVVVANLKGGTGKTTTAGYLAHALYERDHHVLAVDADPQESLLRWQADADWPISAIALADPKLDKKLPGIVGDRYNAVVIDTPPLGDEIVKAAVRIATHVVVPMAPTSSDFERLEQVRELLDGVASERPRHKRPVVAVLLTQAVSQAVATRVYRDLAGQQLPVFKTRVAFLQRFAQAVGAPIWDASATAYGDVLTELEAMKP